MKIELELVLYHPDWCDYCPLAHVGDENYPWYCAADFWKNDWNSDQSMKKFFHRRPEECKVRFGI